MRGSRLARLSQLPCVFRNSPCYRQLTTTAARHSGWQAALSHASRLVESDTPDSAGDNANIDPLSLVGEDMTHLTQNIHALLGSQDVTLDQVAKYYVRDDGAKRIRPLLVLLMARAVPPEKRMAIEDIDDPMSPANVLNDANPSSIRHSQQHQTQRRNSRGQMDQTQGPVAQAGQAGQAGQNRVSASQRRLAEITEMIHAASLLHDDVIDESAIRRGRTSANFQFSPKMSVLAGDFMLGRASVALARLRHPEVIELLATVIANLVEGEFMQLRNTIDEGQESTMEYYLQKTYLKTASLIAKSCRASAILGGGSREHVDAAYGYGRNLGLAFQIVDDMLDYSANAADLGKPSNADLKLGLATAPVLFAWRRHPQLGSLIKRKFQEDGDVELARRLALDSDGLERTRELAERYCRDALTVLAKLPPGQSRDALEGIAHQVLTRTK